MNQLIKAKQQELKQTLGLIDRADYANLLSREVYELEYHAREVQKDIELLELIRQTELVMGVMS
jgi:hypothetical protein